MNNRLEKSIFKWLDHHYGELEMYDDVKFIYYFSNDDIIFDFLPINKRVIISDVLWDNVRQWFPIEGIILK